MHHEIQVKNGQKYHYIAENIRIGKEKWKKVRIYIGKGNLSKKDVKNLIHGRKRKLEEMVRGVRNDYDPLYSLLSESQIKKLTAIKNKYQESMKGIDGSLWQNQYEAFVTEFTYDTNAIEGSSLTLSETGLILFDKVVPEGRTIKEVREAENHKDAFDFMLAHKEDITKRFILTLHKKLMHNILWKHSGTFRDVQVAIRGADFLPPPPKEVGKEFKKLMRWYGSNKKKYNPVIVAAYVHFVFESIHPFRDGNGRAGRLLMNFILRKNGYPMIDIKNKERGHYYESLQAAHSGNLKPLVEIIARHVIERKIWI